jgi:hypothetical protein
MKFKSKFFNFHFSASVKKIDDSELKYIDLTPVDNADPDGSYTDALTFAMTNDRIKNIAITGPYGSGKSSIINTFEKNTSFKCLNISLASFKENNEKSEDDTSQDALVERSILQQMLYGASANKLPYSRFKRISTPEHPLGKSFVALCWALSVLFLYENTSYFTNIEFFHDSMVSLLSLITIALSIPVVLVSDIYRASFGLSFKKISLTNAEIEIGDTPESSVLNKHLDEIIYFFQSTEYDVVVIEDLDRFGSPEIFVKLREINKLINDNDKKKGSVKFLYALKDDMFVHKNRAKFFDFIIPILPIINSSNSLDKMQERLGEMSLLDEIDSRFLREVSLYIDDLRLIHNIFNEFTIYKTKLSSDSLNATKLLAMIIYKNMYPNDFENLHHGKGALYSVSDLRSKLIVTKNEVFSEGILKAKKEIQDSEGELVSSVEELIRGFIGYLFVISERSVSHIVIEGKNVPFKNLLDWDCFIKLFDVNNIELYSVDRNHYERNFNIGKSFSELQEEISPDETFKIRKLNVENKARNKISKIKVKIQRLEKEKSVLAQLPLNQLLQDETGYLDVIISKAGFGDSRLFSYLVKNGHIDETYHMYTSTFHEGRLTKNDRNFLLAIRDFKSPDYNQVIDTPKEVCKNMRNEDFEHKNILNVFLIDHLLTDKSENPSLVKSAINFIARNFKVSEDFFISYWLEGKNIKGFTHALSEQWPGYASAALKGENSASHIAAILSHANNDSINNMNNEGMLTKYLSENGHLAILSDLNIAFDRYLLIGLCVKFTDLSLLEDFDDYIEYSHDHNLYALNQKNILLLIQRYSSSKDTDEHSNSNYSSLSSQGCEKIKSYVDKNLQEYIGNVFLTLPNNTKENEGVVKSLINHQSLGLDMKKEIIRKEEYVFEDFDNVQNEMWECLILEDKVLPSWKVILEYFSLDGADKEILTEKLQGAWLDDLAKTSIVDVADDNDRKLEVSAYIVNNNDLNITSYSLLIKKLPYYYGYFPDVSLDKKISLVEVRRVRLAEKSFLESESNNELRALLIERNESDYFSSKEDYIIDDNVIEILLVSRLITNKKIELCHDVTLAGITSNKKLAKIMADILSKDHVDCREIDDEIMIEVIRNSQSMSNSIRLLNKSIKNWNEAESMAVIETLDSPLSDIADYGKRPKIHISEVNLKFVELLESKGFISSFKKDKSFIKINTFNSINH